MAVPSTYQVPGQIPYHSAESASADVQKLSRRSFSAILPVEAAAASEAAAAADSAPSRSYQSLHGMRNSHQGPASVTASSQGVLQDHRQQHQHKGVSLDHPNQHHLDLQISNRDPRQHAGDHDQWTHHADDQAQLNHPASGQSEVQTQSQIQSQVQPEYESAWSPQPLLSVGTTAAPAASYGRDSLARYTNASPSTVKPTVAQSSDSLSGSGPASQLLNPHALSSTPLLSSSDQKQTVARAGQPPSSPLGPATPPEAQVGSAELCSVSPTLSAQPLSSSGVQEAAEEEEDSMRQLSVRERALRSLSSKGIQLGRSASNKASRFGHAKLESGSETAGRSVQGSRQQLQDGDSTDITGSNLDKDSDGMDGAAENSQGLSQRAEAVRALSLRLDMGNKTQL